MKRGKYGRKKYKTYSLKRKKKNIRKFNAGPKSCSEKIKERSCPKLREGFPPGKTLLVKRKGLRNFIFQKDVNP